MRKMHLRAGLVAGIVLAVLLLTAGIANAVPARQFEDPVEQGKYLTEIAMCSFCHTPFKEPYITFENLTLEELRQGTFDISQTLDQDRLFAGGHEIPLGPAGVIVTRNLTSDVETGLGGWTDEEIKVAIRSGISRDGHQLNPVMPYQLYNAMAESDLDAIVAFLRTLPPIENEIEHEPDQHMLMPEFPPVPVIEGIVAPGPSNVAARGEYLMGGVVLCALCHTPVDETTGEPIMDQFLAGGQPFEGPWGIVYGGNLTPHEATGIATWTDDEIKLVLSSGILHDGRRSVLMPWKYFTDLTAEDADAIVHYLRNNVLPVDREVPAPFLQEDLFEYIELSEPETLSLNPGLIGVLVLAALIVVVGGGILVRRRMASSGNDEA